MLESQLMLSIFASPQRSRAFAFAAGLSIAAGLFGAGVAFAYLPGYRAHRLLIASGFIAGTGFTLTFLHFRLQIDGFLERAYVYYGLVAVLAAFFPWLIDWCGMRQFGGFDQSMVVDFGWRLLSGQQACSDFPCTAPPSFFLGAYYTFLAFGAQWHSVVLALAVFSLVTFLWSLALLSQLFERRGDRLMFAAALQALCTVPVSYWWYNPVAATSGVIFGLSACVWLRRPRLLLAVLSYFLALVLLATVKANIAGILILIVSGVLFTSRLHRVRAAIVSSLAFATFFLWLRSHGIDVFAPIQAYQGVAGRAFEFGPFFADAIGWEVRLAVFALVLVLLPLAGCARRAFSLRADWRFAAVGFACVLAGLNNFVSAGETKTVDLSLILFGVIIICQAGKGWSAVSPRNDRPAGGGPVAIYLTAIAITGSFIGLATGISRHRVLGIGSRMFFEYKFAKDRIPSGFFRGMRNGEIFKQAYEQMEALVIVNRSRRIFFGPRMQWAYAAFALPAPEHQPVWWHPGVSFPLADEATYIDSFFKKENEVLVFLKNDMTYYRADLIDGIRARYDEDQSYSQLSVFRLR